MPAQFLTLTKAHRLSVSDNRVLRRMFGLRRDNLAGSWRKYKMRSFIVLPNRFRMIKSRAGG
jgi:hypothetical protein